MFFKKIIIKMCLIILNRRKIRNFFKKILNFLFTVKFRDQWVYSNKLPHFYDFEEYEQNFNNISDYNSLQRGYLTSDLIEKNDLLCDIGCGSGFFTKKFYSFKSRSIDAIDIDESAINFAKKYNFSDNINYFNFDILKKNFPQKNYDMIVLDSSMGHFSKSDTGILMNEILKVLSARGLFVGSESLGQDADDHLQNWNSEEELKKYLEKYFKYVYCKTIEYKIRPNYDQTRRECFWRCSNTESGNYRLLNIFK